jgi:guanylate kinase
MNPPTTTHTEEAALAEDWYAALSIPRPLLVVISGPSGVGKDATIRRMKERGYACHFVVTATTRAPRPSERDGIDYHFLSLAAFQKLIATGELIEHAEVYGQYKGIPKADIRAAVASGTDAIMRVDVQGAARVSQLIPQAVTIFLTAESDEALVDRLRSRCSESESELIARITAARAELIRGSEFKYRVVNRMCALDETVDEVMAIIRAEKCRTDWQPVSL